MLQTETYNKDYALITGNGPFVGCSYKLQGTQRDNTFRPKTIIYILSLFANIL